MKKIFKVLLFLLITCSLVVSCSEYEYSGSDGDETGSINFHVEWRGAPSLSDEISVTTRALLPCAAFNIETVAFEIVDANDNPLAGDSWGCSVGEGTVYGVPAGKDRKLIVEGKDDQDRVLYRGEVEGIVVTAGKHTDVKTVVCEPVAIINFAYLQYRTYADDGKAPEYKGWIDFTIEGNPIDLSDIPQISLKNASGSTVYLSRDFYSYSYYTGKWNDVTSSVEFAADPIYEAGFIIEFPEGSSFPAGDYTYEATTRQETSITTTLFFPGATVLPTVDVDSMFSEWVDPNNSLHLSWNNPVGEYDHLRIVIWDQDYHELLYVTLPPNAENLMVPDDIVQNMTDLRHPSSAKWEIQTRSYTTTDDHNNYARGYSGKADIPSWQP